MTSKKLQSTANYYIGSIITEKKDEEISIRIVDR
jgi:hypothetical protein